MAFSISTFKSNVTGFLKPSKFEFILEPPPGLTSDKIEARPASFLIEASALPGVGFGTHDVRPFGYGINESRPVFPNFQKLNLSFLSDNEGKVYNYLHSWVSLIINHDVNVSLVNGGRYEMKYRTDYIAPIATVVQYNDDGTEKIRVNYNEVWPLQVADIQLNWSNSGELMRVPAVFSFRDWNIVKN